MKYLHFYMEKAYIRCMVQKNEQDKNKIFRKSLSNYFWGEHPLPYRWKTFLNGMETYLKFWMRITNYAPKYLNTLDRSVMDVDCV